MDLRKVDALTLRQVLLLLEKAVEGEEDEEEQGGSRDRDGRGGGGGRRGGDGAGANGTVGAGQVAQELDCHVDTMSKLVKRRRIKKGNQ